MCESNGHGPGARIMNALVWQPSQADLPRVGTAQALAPRRSGRRNDLLTFEACKTGRPANPKIKRPDYLVCAPAAEDVRTFGVSAVPAVLRRNTTTAGQLSWNITTHEMVWCTRLYVGLRPCRAQHTVHHFKVLQKARDWHTITAENHDTRHLWINWSSHQASTAPQLYPGTNHTKVHGA